MKKIILLAILAFSLSILKSQSVDKAFELYNSEKYHEASIEFENLEPMMKMAYGSKDTVNYTKMLLFTGVSFSRDLNFYKAEKYYLQAISIYQSYSPEPINKWYATILNNTAELYRNAGRYTESEEYQLKALEIRQKVYQKEHSDIAGSYNNLAVLYSDLGEFEKAESYLKMALDIDEKIYGKESKDYAIDLNNIAMLYQTMGNYPKAEKLYLEVIDIRKKVLGEKNVDYAISLNNLASLYSAMENYDDAEKLYLETLEILKLTAGTQNKDYATALNNIGTLYTNKKEYTKAEESFLEALNVYKKIFDEDHVETAHTYNNLATLYHSQNEYNKAEPYYLKAIEILKNYYGTSHFEYAKAISNLSGLYYNKGDYKKAQKYVIESNKLIDNLVINSGLFMSENERELYLRNNIIYNYDANNSFYLAQSKNHPEYAGYCYNNALLIKGILLRSNIALRNSVLNSKNQELIDFYNDWILNGTLLLNQQNTPTKERKFDLDSLTELVNQQEKELILKFPQTFKNIANTKWEDIKSSLEKDEAAIEFVSFRYHTEQHWSDSIYYCALILTKNMKYPEIVYLCEEKTLSDILFKDPNLFSKYDNPEYYYIKGIYDKTSSKSDSLYKFIWQPIEEYVNGKKKIYISPAGLLNRVSFKALSMPDSSMLSDNYDIVYLSSTSNIVAQSDLYINKLKKFVLFGDINYSADTNAIKKYSESIDNIAVRNTTLQKLNSDNRSVELVWEKLEGSKKEIENIEQLLSKSLSNIEVYTGFRATEEVLKEQVYSSPTMLHIATHGFYFPETFFAENGISEEAIGVYGHIDNPLVRSGIVLAGANWGWSGTNNIYGAEDGILSAYEVSHLDMNNVKLVVLSACQTGLGDVIGSEGVYGLQRGLKMAGVDYIILSLWEVPDEQTQQLMTKFYTYFYNGMEVRDAFDKAQNDLKEEYRDVKGGAFAWAAFVLVF
ncbi:MAG: CHAT domain-containing protein [Bacteroidales bacterium]|nr:CHAT domain-containing protein [Bacteroidales bacterium]